MAFFGTSSAGASTATTPVLDTSKSLQLRQEIQDQISQELAVANATELVNKITENCFQKCIAQPSSALSGPEEMCVNQCLEKYMRSWNVISKAYITRIQQSTNSQN